MFSPFPRRRLHSNNLHCDCHLSWLSDWLRARRGLAPFTQCMAPANMRGLNVPDVPKKDFVCNGKVTLTHLQRTKHRAEALLSTTNSIFFCLFVFTSCFFSHYVVHYVVPSNEQQVKPIKVSHPDVRERAKNRGRKFRIAVGG